VNVGRASFSAPTLAFTNAAAAASAADGVGHFYGRRRLFEWRLPARNTTGGYPCRDVEGYSRLMHGDEEATMATLSARRALVDELIARHRGSDREYSRDSVLAEFASVLDAIRCAVEIQGAIERANEGEPEGRRMRFRIGINCRAGEKPWSTHWFQCARVDNFWGAIGLEWYCPSSNLFLGFE